MFDYDYHRKNLVSFIGKTRIANGVILDPAMKEAYKTQQNPPEWELYDLFEGPYELENLASKEDDQLILEEMKEV